MLQFDSLAIHHNYCFGARDNCAQSLWEYNYTVDEVGSDSNQKLVHENNSWKATSNPRLQRFINKMLWSSCGLLEQRTPFFRIYQHFTVSSPHIATKKKKKNRPFSRKITRYQLTIISPLPDLETGVNTTHYGRVFEWIVDGLSCHRQMLMQNIHHCEASTLKGAVTIFFCCQVHQL